MINLDSTFKCHVYGQYMVDFAHGNIYTIHAGKIQIVKSQFDFLLSVFTILLPPMHTIAYKSWICLDQPVKYMVMLRLLIAFVSAVLACWMIALVSQYGGVFGWVAMIYGIIMCTHSLLAAWTCVRDNILYNGSWFADAIISLLAIFPTGFSGLMIITANAPTRPLQHYESILIIIAASIIGLVACGLLIWVIICLVVGCRREVREFADVSQRRYESVYGTMNARAHPVPSTDVIINADSE